jgi:N-ethylmaleimide reductase
MSKRAGAGLIITEGTSPSPNGLGYARIPGLFLRCTSRRLEEKFTSAVSCKKGVRFFVSIYACRKKLDHPNNFTCWGQKLVGPSAIKAKGAKCGTDKAGMQEHPVFPRENE